jgi:hypothetical protein
MAYARHPYWNRLSQRRAQARLSAPDITTLRGLRDRAILAALLGRGLIHYYRMRIETAKS